MNRKSLFALFLCVTLVFSLCACTQEPNPDATEAPTEDPYLGVYAQAADAVEAATDLQLKLTTLQKTSVGIDHYELESTQTLHLAGIGTETFQVSLTEDMRMGEYNDHLDEYYADGTLYVTVEKMGFRGAMDAEAYLSQFAPAVLIDETLYGQVTSAPDGENQRVTFADPTAPESWAMPADAEFVSAEGSALLDAAGVLVESTYTVTYRQLGMLVELEVTAAPTVSQAAPTAPANMEAFTELDCIEAIRLYDTAVLYLCNTGSASSIMTESNYCQAAGYTWTQQTKVDYHGLSATHASKVDTTISEYQEGGGTSTYTQNELFVNSAYSTSVNGGAPQANTAVNFADMLYYVQGLLLDNCVSLEYITSATSSDVGGLMYLELGLNEDYANIINEYLCSTLFEDPQFLNNLASAYKTTTSTGYIAIDPVTCFPVAMGMQYSGIHTIDGVEYTLAQQFDQTIQVSNTTAYNTITGKDREEKAPETTATPLLYHVTGADGQEMYLMGTIHVGDERTGFLPDAVYTALDGSDALAVEFDVMAFEEAMTTDAALAAQISALYINADGSSTSALLEEADSTEAIRLLTISGNYNAMVDLMKPAIWNQSIDNYYMTFDRGITSDKGLDMRLLKRAKEAGMEIRDIESGLAQMEMMTGYSTELQLMLLKESLDVTAAEYCAEVRDLYEAWCRGDEAELRGLMEEDLSDMTEEELALYQEYIDAMVISRNASMLEVAKAYLESGDTVFYAVGLAHLLQENGLVDALKEAGYTVEAVSYGR